MSTDLSGLGTGIRGIAVLPDGRILAAGVALRNSALVRLPPPVTSIRPSAPRVPGS